MLLMNDHVDDPLSVFDMRHEASIPRTFLFSLNPIKHIIQKIANKYADVIQKVCVEVVVVSVLNYRIQIISETDLLACEQDWTKSSRSRQESASVLTLSR